VGGPLAELVEQRAPRGAVVGARVHEDAVHVEEECPRSLERRPNGRLSDVHGRQQ